VSHEMNPAMRTVTEGIAGNDEKPEYTITRFLYLRFGASLVKRPAKVPKWAGSLVELAEEIVRAYEETENELEAKTGAGNCRIDAVDVYKDGRMVPHWTDLGEPGIGDGRSYLRFLVGRQEAEACA